MRRRALLHAGALSAALGSAGCLTTLTRARAGRVHFDSGSARLHAVSDPWVAGGIGDGTDDVYGDLFTETPDESPFVGGRYGRREVVGDVMSADYDRQFVLVYEARMRAEDPFLVLPGVTSTDPEWTGWQELSLPLEVDPHDSEGVAEDLRDEDELVCTTVVTYVTHPEEEPLEVKPESATVELYDEAGGRRGGTVTVTAGEG